MFDCDMPNGTSKFYSIVHDTQWTESVKKNVEVFRRTNTRKSIWNTMRLRRKSPVRGHLIRNNPRITVTIEGEIEGRPGRERPRTPSLKHVMERYRNRNTQMAKKKY